MSKKAFQAIADGLEDAIAFSKGVKTRGRVRKVRVSDVDIAATRGKLGLSQEQFAAAVTPVVSLESLDRGLLSR